MKINDIEMKPCPFCNSKKLKLETKNGKLNHYMKNGMNIWQNVKFSVRCNSCHARGGVISVDLPTDHSKTIDEIKQLRTETELKAILKWNNRPYIDTKFIQDTQFSIANAQMTKHEIEHAINAEIKLSNDYENGWNRACKYILANFKKLIETYRK